ncbi:MAG: SEC-C domain-containing protein [Planctomycetes bacterium]|nr:SEC-C domain-containing protein [Planctomycetota bacterium]MBL7147037.1 SEC-C domain-containing protein [Phycisphaerae bacterium]
MGKVSKSENSYCPLAQVDRRLEDVRLAWIETQKNYNEPDEFRRKLNECVTTLRSVTFVLQKHKKVIPDFEAWYEKWQKSMRDDDVMVWLVRARNYIVKEGDLKTLSVANATVTLDWGMSIHQKLLVDPFLSTSLIAQMIRESIPIEKEKTDSALLEVERRWVDAQLPDYEVLDALSYCYSFIAKLLKDAHAQVGIRGWCPYMKARGIIEIDQKRIEHLGGRPPCMVATRGMRTVMMKLSTGEEFSLMTYSKAFDQKDAEKAAKHYGVDTDVELFKKEPRDLRKEAEYWFSMAKVILTKDGYHIPMLILGPPNPELVQLVLEDHVDKHVMWGRVADRVEVSGAEWFMFIGEIWLRVPEEKLNPTSYSYKPREALRLIAASNDGGFVSICAEFKREGNSIHFLKENLSQKESPIDSCQLEPVRRVWTGEVTESSTKIDMPKIRLAKVPWIEDENTACPCGSGVPFANCCKAYVQEGKKQPKEVRQADISEMEKVYRGALSTYLGYVVRYTIPALKEFPEKIAQLVNVDIKALCEVSENIALYLEKQGRTKEAIRLFRHIRETVKLPGLDKRMLYMEAIWHDAMIRDRAKAREVLSRIDIEQEDDIEILQFYLNIFELASEQKLKLIDRILEGPILPSISLQYNTLKSVCLHMEGHNEKATDVICSAIEQYAIDPEHIPDHYYMNICGRAYAWKWRLTQDETDFRKALKYYMTLNYKEFTPFGKASLYREIAELYSVYGNYPKAIKYYKLSLKNERSEVGIIHLAECYIHKGRVRRARKILRCISFEGLEEVCRQEFLSVLALLAIKTNDKELGEDTIRKLSLLMTCHKYFEEQRNEKLEKLTEKFKSTEKER